MDKDELVLPPEFGMGEELVDPEFMTVIGLTHELIHLREQLAEVQAEVAAARTVLDAVIKNGHNPAPSEAYAAWQAAREIPLAVNALLAEKQAAKQRVEELEQQVAKLSNTTKIVTGHVVSKETRPPLVIPEDEPLTANYLLRDAINEGYAQHSAGCSGGVRVGEEYPYHCKCGLSGWLSEVKEALEGKEKANDSDTQ